VVNTNNYALLAKFPDAPGACLALIDELKLRDYVEPNLRKLVFKHLHEHGEQMVDSPKRPSVSQTQPPT